MSIELSLWNFICKLKGKNWWHNRHYPPSFRVREVNGHIVFRTSNKNSTVGFPAQTMENSQSGACNILLSGPSVRSIENPLLLGNRYTIGVNGSPELLLKHGIACNSYIVGDHNYLCKRTDDFLRFARNADDCFLPYRGILMLLNMGVPLDGIRIRVFDLSMAPFRKYKQIHERPYFASSFGNGLGICGTIAYVALQIAYCLGFRKLYLFGMDLSLEGRFYQEAQKEPQKLHKKWDKGIIEPFTLVGNMAAAGEWSVINCSPQSRLPESILPKMDPNQALLL